MVHVDKDGYAVASASFGSHSLDRKKLNAIASDVAEAYPDYLHSNSLMVFRKIRSYINANHPGLSEAETVYILKRTTRY